MRRLVHRLLFVCSIAPAVAQAAPPRKGAQPEKRAVQPTAPRGAKTSLVLKETPPRGAATEQSSKPARPDICAIEQQDKKSVTMRSHRIERGDSLSGIAWRYGTSVKALAAANGLTEEQKIRTGQRLVIPQHTRLGGGDDWLKYASPAKQRGRLDLVTYKSRFVGPVVENGKVLPSARQRISTLLGASGTHPAISERLIRLLVRVSDTFGGRQLRVVSGYRSSSYFSDSRHKSSEAVDFSMPGVPNAVLRQYLLLLDDVGVGYYPNSSFVHLDVRGCAMQWVDYAGPGEAPRIPGGRSRNVVASKGTAAGESARGTGTPRASDLDDIAEEVVAAMEEAAKRPAVPTATAAPAPPEPGATRASLPDPLAASHSQSASR